MSGKGLGEILLLSHEIFILQISCINMRTFLSGALPAPSLGLLPAVQERWIDRNCLPSRSRHCQNCSSWRIRCCASALDHLCEILTTELMPPDLAGVAEDDRSISRIQMSERARRTSCLRFSRLDTRSFVFGAWREWPICRDLYRVPLIRTGRPSRGGRWT